MDKQTKSAIRIDIGGTNIKYTLINSNSDVFFQSSTYTETNTGPGILKDSIISLIKKLIPKVLLHKYKNSSNNPVKANLVVAPRL